MTHPFLKLMLIMLACLACNEELVKLLLLLYKRLINAAVTGDAFCHFPPVRHTVYLLNKFLLVNLRIFHTNSYKITIQMVRQFIAMIVNRPKLSR